MGRILIVGLGPGNMELMTPAAGAAISRADVLCGYTLYLDLLKDRYPDKEIFTTPMTREMERCRWAIKKALEGRTVAMLCSGDAGVYGMAGPLILLLEEEKGSNDFAAERDDGLEEDPGPWEEIEIEIVPGITAALSGAALLGAPLMNDFCVISLSDYLTPWESIEKRLRAAAAGDFSIVFYNPRSKKRPDHLQRACDILLEEKSSDTVCGWVRNIGREGQEAHILTLRELRDADLDMLCTAFVGSSRTKAVGEYMVTPRGYDAEEPAD